MLENLGRLFVGSRERQRIDEVSVAREVVYGELTNEYLKSSVRISMDLKLPYHEQMAETRKHLSGCCYRTKVDLSIDTYGGKDKEYLKQNNFRIADIAFLTDTQGAIEDILKRLEGGSFSRAGLEIARDRLIQLEEYQHLGLQHVYTVNGIKPKESNDVLYDWVFNGAASEVVCRNIEIGKVLDRRGLLYDRRISDIYPILGNLSMQVNVAE